MPKGHNIYQWLSLSKTELCGTSCLGEFCKVHLAKLCNGSCTQPCQGCGVWVTNKERLCIPCGYRAARWRYSKADSGKSRRNLHGSPLSKFPFRHMAPTSIPADSIMPTVKELRKQAKSYGLRGYSTLRKPGLIRLIAEARTPVFRERLKHALKNWALSSPPWGYQQPTQKKHNAFESCISLRMRSQQPCGRKNTSKKVRATPSSD